MTHVVAHPIDPIPLTRSLSVHQVPAARDNLVWLLVESARGEAAAVDGPGADAALAACERLGVRLTTILNTHTHGDHVGINRALASRGALAGMRVIGARGQAVPGLTEPVEDADTVDLWGVAGRVLRTEGHIDGHISFVFPGTPAGVLFCGDALFTGGCGYLFDGPPAKMHASLARLAALPPETLVCCAHEYTEDNLRFAGWVEPDNAELITRIRSVRALRAEGRCAVPSTIRMELQTNPFLRSHAPTLQRRLAEECPGVPLETPLEVFTAARRLKDTGRHRAVPVGV